MVQYKSLPIKIKNIKETIMDKYLPYIVTIICTLISGFISYFAARRQSKADIEKLQTGY